MTPTSVTADLRFSRSDSGAATSGDGWSGTLTGSGSRLDLQLSAVPVTAIRQGRVAVRQAADLATGLGLTLSIRTPDGPVVELGAGVRPGVLDRLVLRAGHAHVISWARLLRGRRTRPGDPVLTSLSDVLPPATLWPPAPTFRTRRQGLRTTHDPRGGGRPRLYFAAPERYAGDAVRVFYLRREGVAIGDDPTADLRLAGLFPRHARVTRNDLDEYVVEPVGPITSVRVNGTEVSGPTVLRTGTKIEIGDWRMSYFREEWADHGRPFAGRVGGELGVQQVQQRPSFR